MQKLTRFIPPLLWLGAAALVFPAFTPNGYNAVLFGGRLAAAVVCLALAYFAFRTPHWFKPQLAAGVVGLVAANYISDSGFDLIPPAESHLRTLVEEGLAVQGTEAVAEYTDLAISGMKCSDWRDSWECDFGLSYKSASANKVHENELMNIRYDKGNGERFQMIAAKGCEFDFQWSQRLRASSHYTPDMEPLVWSDCNGNKDGTAYVRGLAIKGGHGLQFVLPKGDKAAPLTVEPFSLWYAENMVKEYFDAGMGSTIACNYLPSNPLEVRCAISGTRAIWEGNVATMSDPFGTSTTQVRGKFRESVRIAPEGGRWAIIK